MGPKALLTFALLGLSAALPQDLTAAATLTLAGPVETPAAAPAAPAAEATIVVVAPAPVVVAPAPVVVAPAPVVLADAITLSNQATAGPYNVSVGVSPWAPGQTLYIPRGLPNGTAVPVFAWLNAYCAKQGLAYRSFLTEIASNGYLVVAPGAGRWWTRGEADSDDQKESLRSALNWARQAGFPANASRLAVGGHSCGGYETAKSLATDYDGQLTTGIIFSSGARNDTLDGFFQPSLWVTGGASDVASQAATTSYAYLSTANKFTPTVAASINAGNNGTFWTARGGAYAEIAVRWLDAWTKASQPALDFFLAGTAAPAAAATRGWTILGNSVPTVVRP